jgi:hypothetical protein
VPGAVNVLDLEARVSVDKRDFDRGMRDVDSTADRTSGKLGKGLGLLGGAGIAAAGALAGLGAAAMSAGTAASDLNEATNVTGLIFKDARGEIDEFVKGTAKIGLTETEAREATGTFGGLLQNLKLSRSESVKWSKDLTVLASDMGSAFNEEPVEVVQAIGSALRGETEPIRRFNVMLSDMAVRQKAVEMGLAESTKEVDAAGKAQATLGLIMEQTKAVQGDFTNTSDGMANSQRILRAEWGNMQAELGKAVVPAMQLGVSVMREMLPVVFEIANGLGEHLGPIMGGLGKTAQDVFPSVKEVFLGIVGFVQENVIPIVKELFEIWRGTWEGIVRVLRENQPAVDNIVKLVKGVMVLLMETIKDLMPVIRFVFQTVLPIAIGIMLDAVNLIAPVLIKLVGWFNTARDGVVSAVGFFRDFIDGAVGAITGFFGGLHGKIVTAVSGLTTFFGPDGGFRKPFREAKEWVGTLVGGIVQFWADLPGGIARAIASGADAIKGAVMDLFGALPGWAKKILGISSPSKVFEEIGRNVVQGFIGGLGSMAGDLRDKALSMAKEAIKGVGGFLGGIGRALGIGDEGGGSVLGTLLAFARQAGLTVTSTTGGRHAAGSFHYQGRAIDVAGSFDSMVQFFRDALATFGSSIRELFFDPMGFYVDNGNIVPGAIGGHSDHVHLALGDGGIFTRPWTGMATIGERGVEGFVPLDSPRASRFMGGSSIVVNVYPQGSVIAERDLGEMIRGVLTDEARIGRGLAGVTA